MPASRKDHLVSMFELHERAKLAPAEAHGRSPARNVDGIVGRVAALHELFHPWLGIIVDPDEAGGSRQAGMVKKREMMEAELKRGIAQCIAKLQDMFASSGDFSEPIDEALHELLPSSKQRFILARNNWASRSAMGFSTNKLAINEYI